MNVAERRAAEWIARLHADDRSAADEAAWRAWLDEDRNHAAAFERVTMLWELVPGSGAVAVADVPSALTRRRMLKGIGAVAVTGGGALIGASAACGGTRYETGIGERRKVLLKDGSRLLLDAASRVRVNAWPHYRKLWLEEGRLRLSIAPADEPFEVHAGGEKVTASRGRLDMRRDSDAAFSVTSIAGGVNIAGPAGRRDLSPGERLRAGAGAVSLDRPDAAQTDAWIVGRSVFQDEALAQVVREANRYASPPLAIADRRTAALRVSGVYHLGDNAALARSLAALHGLDVRREGDAIVLGEKMFDQRVG